jgi:hypothetical protein
MGGGALQALVACLQELNDLSRVSGGGGVGGGGGGSAGGMLTQPAGGLGPRGGVAVGAGGAPMGGQAMAPHASGGLMPSQPAAAAGGMAVVGGASGPGWIGPGPGGGGPGGPNGGQGGQRRATVPPLSLQVRTAASRAGPRLAVRCLLHSCLPIPSLSVRVQRAFPSFSLSSHGCCWPAITPYF